ncbi:MAG: hypothetical protein ACLT2Z_06035 [Eubacterium sp.]
MRKPKKYYEEFWEWSDSEKIISYMFEADEPWKGGNNRMRRKQGNVYCRQKAETNV